MAKVDMKSSVQIAKAIQATLAGTTPSKGNIIDLAGFEACTFAFMTGTVTDAGAAAGFSFEIQETDTTADVAFTAVADSDLVGLESVLSVTLDTDDGVPVGTIGYVGNKRYVRCVVTGTALTDAVINGIAFMSHAIVAPPATKATNIAAT